MKQKLFTLLLALIGLTTMVCAQDEHYYVDLGLPSGTLWATTNVGATTPGEAGTLLHWGGTTGITEYYQCTNWMYYPLCEGADCTLTKYNSNDFYGTVDNKTALEPIDDAATQLWGNEWCMPTREQCLELANPAYTTMEWAEEDYNNGIRITSKSNGNSIFIPAAGVCWFGSGLSYYNEIGFYWTRELYADNPANAFAMTISETDIAYSNTERYRGCRVRPVRSGRGEESIVKVLNPDRYDVDGSGDVSLADLTLLANALVGRVNYPATGLTLEQSEVALILGSSTALTAVITPSTADYKQLYWKTSASAVATVSPTGEVAAVGIGTCTITCKTVDGSNLSASCTVTVAEPSGGASGYVDLGLPSHTLWATHNVGATAPEEYGNHYVWGETTSRTEWPYNGSYFDSNYAIYNVGDGLKELKPEHDAAYVNWGSEWRMPTYEQMQELINTDYTTQTTTTYNGVKGLLIVSKVAGYQGNAIFLPAAGYFTGNSTLLQYEGERGSYWTRTLYQFQSGSTSGNYYGRYLFFNTSCDISYTSRAFPSSIRPVRASNQ